ncbi:hypothetical protein McanMca71_007572 [Microsporum canis]
MTRILANSDCAVRPVAGVPTTTPKPGDKASDFIVPDSHSAQALHYGKVMPKKMRHPAIQPTPCLHPSASASLSYLTSHLSFVRGRHLPPCCAGDSAGMAPCIFGSAGPSYPDWQCSRLAESFVAVWYLTLVEAHAATFTPSAGLGSYPLECELVWWAIGLNDYARVLVDMA